MSDESPLVSGTLADQEAAMRKGKGGMLVIMGALAVAVVAGLALVMGGNDEARVYRELGKKVNGLKQAHFDRFWGCALPGTVVRDINTNAELSFQIDARAAEKGQAYAVHVRDTCLDALREINPELEPLIVPDDLRPHVEAMKDAIDKLRSGFSGFIGYLDDPELDYDADTAQPMIEKIARGWYEFKKAHAAFNQMVKKKLE